MEIEFVREPERSRIQGTSRSSNREYQDDGLAPTPVKIGRTSVAWIKHELLAVNAARAAGKSDDEIRKLVATLKSQRAQAFEEITTSLANSAQAKGRA